MIERERLMELEEYLQDHKVFYNGIRGEDHPCHSDSYIAIVHQSRLECAIKLCKQFSQDEIDSAIEYWLECPGIALRVVAVLWKNSLKQT